MDAGTIIAGITGLGGIALGAAGFVRSGRSVEVDEDTARQSEVERLWTENRNLQKDSSNLWTEVRSLRKQLDEQETTHRREMQEMQERHDRQMATMARRHQQCEEELAALRRSPGFGSSG